MDNPFEDQKGYEMEPHGMHCQTYTGKPVVFYGIKNWVTGKEAGYEEQIPISLPDAIKEIQSIESHNRHIRGFMNGDPEEEKYSLMFVENVDTQIGCILWPEEDERWMVQSKPCFDGIVPTGYIHKCAGLSTSKIVGILHAIFEGRNWLDVAKTTHTELVEDDT